MNVLDSIEVLDYLNLKLRCRNGVRFEASMNRYNRVKFDQMRSFPELEIEHYSVNRGLLRSEGIEVVVDLERIE